VTLRSHYIAEEASLYDSQVAINLAQLDQCLTILIRSLISHTSAIRPSLPRRTLPYRWPWEVRSPRRRAWTASVGGIQSPSGHAAASSPASAAPRGPHPWGTPRALPASASARCAALSDCCNSSPALPAKGKTRYRLSSRIPRLILLFLRCRRSRAQRNAIDNALSRVRQNHFRWSRAVTTAGAIIMLTEIRFSEPTITYFSLEQPAKTQTERNSHIFSL